MKNFFIQFRCFQAKNKAQEELQKFMYEYQNTLCDENGLNCLVQEFKQKTSEINLKYPRCKKIEITFIKMDHFESFIFSAHTQNMNDTDIFNSSIDYVKRVVGAF